MTQFVALCGLLGFAVSCVAQHRADVSVLGGGGVISGEDQSTSGFVAAGVSAGFPYSTRHRFQIDCFWSRIGGELSAPQIGLNIPDADTRYQFLTTSYVIQGRTGHSRPFFQVGGGILHHRFHSVAGYLQGTTIQYRHIIETETSIAVVFGAGATIDLNDSLFIRPQVRVYGFIGPTLSLAPAVGFGYRF